MTEKRFKEIRKCLGLSQWGLAKTLGVSQGSITIWENGYREPPEEIAISMETMMGESTAVVNG